MKILAIFGPKLLSQRILSSPSRPPFKTLLYQTLSFSLCSNTATPSFILYSIEDERANAWVNVKGYEDIEMTGLRFYIQVISPSFIPMLCEQQAYSHFSSQCFAHADYFYPQQPEPQSPPKHNIEAPLDDLFIVKKLNKANFPVFLAYSPSLNHHFAMKVFPFQKDGKIKPNFINEIRFAQLQHPNVISIVEYQAQKTILLGDCHKDISFILMELAPYGDFFDMIMTQQIPFNEKLARTYFHQLIEGLEYLHSQGVAHLDIKLENLLVGVDFQLKIADFDNACINGQSCTDARGTAFYRAPELMNHSCQDGYAADIYSAAIILFLFKSGGVLPHSENVLFRGMNLFEMMNRDNNTFWAKHCEIQNKPEDYFDDDFKALFNAMVKFNPKDRLSLEGIKKSKWYNGPVYTPQELSYLMNELYLSA